MARKLYTFAVSVSVEAEEGEQREALQEYLDNNKLAEHASDWDQTDEQDPLEPVEEG